MNLNSIIIVREHDETDSKSSELGQVRCWLMRSLTSLNTHGLNDPAQTDCPAQVLVKLMWIQDNHTGIYKIQDPNSMVSW